MYVKTWMSLIESLFETENKNNVELNISIYLYIELVCLIILSGKYLLSQAVDTVYKKNTHTVEHCTGNGNDKVR